MIIIKSNYIGVYWSNSSNKWTARIRGNGKQLYLGLFNTEEEAADAYDNMAYKLRGENTKFNFRNNIHICEANNCNSTKTSFYDGRWVCGKHKTQYKKYGNFLDRTIYDKNNIYIKDNYAYMDLYDEACKKIGQTKFDCKYLDKLKDYKWYIRSDGYVATNNYHGEYAYLHKLIANNFKKNENNYWVDHIDRNKLNNVEKNLRLVNASQNGMNKGIRSNNTSGKTGVHWSEENKAWCAMISVYKKHINLGYFSSYDDAIQCRVEAEKKYFKNFRPMDELDKRLAYDKKNTSLPENPDYNAVNEFMASVNERVVKGEI